ncbi:proteasome subunit alpha [Planobispora rosea]|nr:proteasome subunit alpha [Planobispora rosea]
MPFGYASPEQIMRDKADYARKGIARGRSVVVLQYEHGILFVAPNPSRALHKISEIYDRIGFAAVGRYNEFEALRLGGIRYADVNGYTYDRSDVTARGLANLYAQSLGQIFTESIKSMEVEVVVAEVGDTPDGDAIYRLTFDGSVFDEHGLAAMGGQAEAVSTRLKERYRDGMGLAEALETALAALTEPGGERPPVGQLEVAVLDRNRPHRKFLRLPAPRLERLLAEAAAKSDPAAGATGQPAPGTGAQAPGDPATGPEGDIDTGSGA